MILVTGGTGLVGAHLLYHLLQQHDQVRAIHRATSKLEEVKVVFGYYTSEVEPLFNKIEWVEADITNVPQLEKAFIDITHVYHCAAWISYYPNDYYGLKKTNIEGTANVVNLCLSHQVKKLCYVSSIATLGDSLEDAPIDETNDWNAEANNNIYAITKYGGEMEVWRGVQEGLEAVIVNPGVILGEGYWFSGSGVLISKAAKGMKYYTEGGSGFVDVKDVVTYMIKLMESSISNERYILVGANVLYKDIFSSLSKQFSKRAPYKKISASSLLLLCRMDALRTFLFRSKRKLVKSMVKSLCSVSVYDATKIIEAVEHPFTPLEETLARVSKHYSSMS